MRRRFDVSLNAIIDPAQCGGHDLAALTRSVVAGGATLIQLRDKGDDVRGMVEATRAIVAAAGGVPVVVNDRVDVALAAGAAGAHVGQSDMHPADARRLLGPDAILGLSIRTPEQAEAAPVELLDYVGVGGVYGTLSKANPKPPIGLDGLAAVVAILRRRKPELMIVGIAGIGPGNAAPVIAAGADGVAVISALAVADPQAASRALRAAVDSARERKAVAG